MLVVSPRCTRPANNFRWLEFSVDNCCVVPELSTALSAGAVGPHHATAQCGRFNVGVVYRSMYAASGAWSDKWDQGRPGSTMGACTAALRT